MRQLATTLALLAFLWAGAATVYLLTATGYQGLATGASVSASGVAAHRVTATLLSVKGLWTVLVLSGVTFLAGIPGGVALTHARGQRAATWSVAAILLFFSIISGYSVGLFYLPCALLLVASAVVTLFVRAREPAGPRERGGAA